MKNLWPPGMSVLMTAVTVLIVSACEVDSGSQTSAVGPGGGSGSIKVVGEIVSAAPRKYGPPAIPDIWQYTISFMEPDGARVTKGQVVAQFDVQELEGRLLELANALNEKEKELASRELLARERLSELALRVEEARAAAGRAALKADIPESLLANRDYRANQLMLEHARLALAQQEAEVLQEQRIQETEIAILAREISRIREEAASLQDSLESMSIRAPEDAMVIHSLDHAGNRLSVGDNVWGGRSVVEFPDLEHLELLLQVPERILPEIAAGQAASFTVGATSDKVFDGVVRRIGSIVRAHSFTRPAKVIDVWVEISQPDAELMRPGMSVEVELRGGTSGEAER